MISVLFLEVSRQSCVSFSRCAGCYSRLVLYIVVCKAFYFAEALFFLQLHSLRSSSARVQM